MRGCVGVVVFPGSNSDHDALHVVEQACGHPARFIWHKDHDLSGVDAVILPGGFSYGDYLRTGAIARFSPVMQSVIDFAKRGGPVLGICNGFQILQEAGLLPGAMLRNSRLRFLSQPVAIRVERNDTCATTGLEVGDVMTMPISHGEGNFHASPEEVERLEGEGHVVFRYVSRPSAPAAEANPNGSINAIAGICNPGRNVVGLMPHPERASEPEVGCDDGLRVMQAFTRAAAGALSRPA